MQKLIVASAAILITGVVGAFSVPGNDAQDARRETRRVETKEPRIVEVEDGEIIESVELKDGEWYVQRRRVETPRAPEAPRGGQPRMAEMPMMRMQGAPQPGTWQIVTVRERALLLNTATGETFTLADGDGGLRWQPIPRPDMQPRDMPRGMPEMPRMPGMDRPNAERPNREQLEEKLEQLRKRLKESEGERREQVKKAIEELENTLEKMGKRDREPEKGADRERLRDELQNAIGDIERKIAALKEKAEETDSKKEARKIEEQIGELKDKANALRKELKGLGK
ncbi:MAG: hypothetical protein H6839_16175 [Planctomycetes bacterium]|nr:hypothetical protein [Planctomycetota bacterium]